MTEVENKEEDQAAIADEKVGGAPGDEGSEALGEDDENIEEETIVRAPGLERALVWQIRARDVLNAESAEEGNVGGVDAGPCNEASNTGDVDEPVEDGRAAIGQVQEAQQTHGRSDENGVVGNTAFSGLHEESRRVAVLSETDEDTRATVDVAVTGGDDDEEKHCVDEAREDLDTCKIGSDDEGRSSSVGASGEEVLVGVGNEKTDEEDGQDEEKDDTEEGLLDGAGNGLARVLGLSSRKTNKLSSLV